MGVATGRTILQAVVTLVILGIFCVTLTAEAQQATKVYRIGWLHPGLSRPEPHPSVEAFRQELRELGYVEGQNLVIEYRFAEGKDERLAALAAELVQLKVDVIVAGGAAAIRAAQQATRTIPIVMAGTPDPVVQGFVASLARPGGNTTGLSLLNAELPGKRLEFLKETVPQSMRVAVLANPANASYESVMHNLTVAARALGLHLHVVELRSPDELDAAFAAMTRAGADTLIVIAEPALMDGLRGQVADLAAKSRLPAMYDWRMYVDAGGFMSYGPSLPGIYRRAATYADKILKGTKPADLPVEQPTKFEFVINLKAAKALGLTIPPTVLFQADEVLQ
jgi:putative ABC transport system substrate-binding protein